MRGQIFSLFAAVLAVLPTTAVRAGDIAVGNVIVENPWARATPTSAKVGAGYLGIINIGTSGDKLLSVATDVSERVEIHSTKLEGGVMRMRKLVDGLAIGPRAAITFKPGGYHLMFVGLKRPLKKGEDFNVTLKFAKAGSIDVLFLTTGIGGNSPYPAPDGSGGSASGQSLGSNQGSGSIKN